MRLLLIQQARDILKNKKFCKARYLARKLNISHSLAGQMLSEMKEWSKWTRGTARVTWIKETEL